MVHGELSSVNREPVNHEQSSENREPVNREQRSFEQLVQRGLTIPNVHCRQSQSKALPPTRHFLVLAVLIAPASSGVVIRS